MVAAAAVTLASRGVTAGELSSPFPLLILGGSRSTLMATCSDSQWPHLHSQIKVHAGRSIDPRSGRFHSWTRSAVLFIRGQISIGGYSLWLWIWPPLLPDDPWPLNTILFLTHNNPSDQLDGELLKPAQRDHWDPWSYLNNGITTRHRILNLL